MDFKRTHCPLRDLAWLLPSCSLLLGNSSEDCRTRKGKRPTTSALRKSKVGIGSSRPKADRSSPTALLMPETWPTSISKNSPRPARTLDSMPTDTVASTTPRRHAIPCVGITSSDIVLPGQERRPIPRRFDPKVESRLEAGVKAYCRINAKTSSNAIGYCWTDLGSWPLENPAGKNWVDFIRNLPPDAPGQKAYQSFMERWDGEGGKARDQAFLRLIAREYFRIIGEAQRKHAPHHLVFGDRFAFNTLDPESLKSTLCDGIAIQPPFMANSQRKSSTKFTNSPKSPS